MLPIFRLEVVLFFSKEAPYPAAVSPFSSPAWHLQVMPNSCFCRVFCFVMVKGKVTHTPSKILSQSSWLFDSLDLRFAKQVKGSG